MELAELFAGLDWLMILLFILGSVLISMEFMMPGFGVAGTLGIISLLGGLVLASQLVTPAVFSVIIVVVLLTIVVLVTWAYRSATKGGRMSRLLLLNTKTSEEEGYNSTANLSDLIGMEGTALTVLRPSGLGEFNGRKVDVVTGGEFIDKGCKIKVVHVEAFRVIVTRI